ncbi:MAG: tRNA (adenosine(37)-N6)-threonylcarbamoyltransferase complex transferase subunit TsaD [Deltaproteobacteria bacterium]|nr:tRNA (adenosine(37)-N6)-threonylcarbamoyltransferase complex transferase subunit TsaD [Deltaproteobacteria bacterium]MDQ3295029.1 tRNA (adenosine(37)-N6)-threonylcarbamoyltransferase complex transferase subunit TsaD [Myxococcota bacterium]
MRVLGLESSCDETAAAIVDDGHLVRSDVVASQHDVHARYGGVVPELASRAHLLNVVPVVQAALDRAGSSLDEIDGIAVTNAPGLVGALLVGLQTAKAIAWVTGKPIVGVHHLEGHLSAVYLEPDPPPMPHLALIVSGGHTSLVRVNHHGDVVELGATRDDAAGEAFDKGAKLLGLGYPGGVVIDRLAKSGDPRAVVFPRAMTASSTGAEFSFSGLKTSLLHHVRAHGVPEGQALADLCASYQAAIVELLVRKTRQVARREGLAHVQVCGGVAANSALRAALLTAGGEDAFRVYVPPPHRCTDNAAMIAAAGYHHLVRGERADLALDAVPSAPLPRRA